MDLGRRLRSRGYRLTPQREAILGVLRENAGRPLSPEDIHAMAGKKQPGMGIATIYRTMDLFCELGIAFPVHLRGGYRFYSSSTVGPRFWPLASIKHQVDELRLPKRTRN